MLNFWSIIASCLTIVFITLIDGRLKLCSTLLPYKIAIIGSLVSCPSSLRETIQCTCKASSLFFLAITVSALFVHYRWKINGSTDIMAAFHTQKRLGGVFIIPFKNILWSNHISSTTLPDMVNNLQGVKPDSLIWEDCVLLCLCHCN